MVKPRSKQLSITKKQEIDSSVADSLADKLADKPYGQPTKSKAQDENNTVIDQTQGKEIERITISIPRWMSYALEDMARERKRGKQQNRTVSAIVREALDNYFDANKK